MELIRYIKERDWPVVFGYAFFTGMVATGYYNVTFVQLGLFDLSTRLLGMSEQAAEQIQPCHTSWGDRVSVWSPVRATMPLLLDQVHPALTTALSFSTPAHHCFARDAHTRCQASLRSVSSCLPL